MWIHEASKPYTYVHCTMYINVSVCILSVYICITYIWCMMCIYIYVYIIYMCVYTHKHIYIYEVSFFWIYVKTLTYKHIYTCVHTCTCIYFHSFRWRLTGEWLQHRALGGLHSSCFYHWLADSWPMCPPSALPVFGLGPLFVGRLSYALWDV